MISLRRRGQVYYADFNAGGRLRGSLGTRDKPTAVRLKNRLEFALGDGPKSPVWEELRPVLPASTFRTFCRGAGFKPETTWPELRDAYDIHLQDRVRAGSLAKSSTAAYYLDLERLDEFFTAQQIRGISEITPTLMADFARGYPTCRTARAVFEFAVERDVLSKSPVLKERRARGVQVKVEPYTHDELDRMRAAASDSELLAFLLLRWAGLRRSDAVDLRWGDISQTFTEIKRVALKNGKPLCIPIHQELFNALMLTSSYADGEHVLVFPVNGNREARLYNLIRKLGERAGVKNPRPHRFRHTLASQMLAAGSSVWEVANLLGDTTATVERHYASFIQPMQEKIKNTLDTLV